MLGFLRAQWLPYAVIAAIAACGGLYLFGYMKGHTDAERVHAREIAEALDEQRAKMLNQAEREKDLALKQLRAKYEIQQRVNEVPEPTVSCDLPVECLRWADRVAGTPAHSE